MELVANLLIYGVFLAVTWRWIVSLVDGFSVIAVAVLMAALFALPHAYENFLWGFQSQFLFLFLFGVLHLHGTLVEMRVGIRWWLAQAAGLLGLFSIAAGSMSAAALVAVAGLELLRGRRNAWVWSTLAANVILLGLGLWLLPDAAARAGSGIARFAQAEVGRAICFPGLSQGFWWGLGLQAPWVPCAGHLVAKAPK